MVAYRKLLVMAGSDNHIKPLRLFELARFDSVDLNKDEQAHFRTCEECQRVVQVFARQFDKPWIPPVKKPGDAA